LIKYVRYIISSAYPIQDNLEENDYPQSS
jgi:hypothetical protein